MTSRALPQLSSAAASSKAGTRGANPRDLKQQERGGPPPDVLCPRESQSQNPAGGGRAPVASSHGETQPCRVSTRLPLMQRRFRIGKQVAVALRRCRSRRSRRDAAQVFVHRAQIAVSHVLECRPGHYLKQGSELRMGVVQVDAGPHNLDKLGIRMTCRQSIRFWNHELSPYLLGIRVTSA